MKLTNWVLGFSAGLAFTLAQANSLSEQDAETMQQLKSVALNSDLAFQITESLTTEVGARLTGSAGDAKSVAWAVAKMQALGFDKVWTESLPGMSWQRGDASAAIVSPYPQPLSLLALGGSVPTPAAGIQAPVVQFDDFAALQAAEPGSLKGKIAFVSYRMSRHKDGRGYGAAVGARVNGASVAAEKGALALIIRSVGTDDNRTAHTGLMRYKDDVAKIPAAALSNPDADLLMRQLERGETVTVKLNLSSSFQSTAQDTANVIGELTGSTTPEQVVVLGAHLDSWDVGTGALDDGIGVGMMLAAVKHIKDAGVRPKRTIRVVLFAAEEVGLLGAKAYVEKHQANFDQHVIAAEWDFGNGYIYQMTPGVGAESLNAVRELASYLAPMGVALNPANNGRGQSDMGAITDLGVPAMNFSPDGSDYFDYHHTDNDTLDKVNQASLKQNTAIYTLFAFFAAQAEVDFRK